jgi:hypothetical protein
MNPNETPTKSAPSPSLLNRAHIRHSLRMKPHLPALVGFIRGFLDGTETANS